MGHLIKRIRGSTLAARLKELQLPRVALIKPSSTAILLILITAFIFIMGGGVYDILTQPLALLPTPSYPIFFYFGLQEQTLNESLFFMLFLTTGVAGGYIAYRSTRYPYRPREATIQLVIGIAMLFLSFVACEYILSLKRVV